MRSNDIGTRSFSIIFKDGVVDHYEILSLAQLKVWSWLSSKVSSAYFSYSDWCLAPLICLRHLSFICLCSWLVGWCFLSWGWYFPKVLLVLLVSFRLRFLEFVECLSLPLCTRV